MDAEFFESVSISSNDKGRLKFAKGAVNYVGDPESPDMLQKRPLHIAASNIYDNSATVEALVNADVNAQDSWGNTPLNLAAIYHNKNIIEALLKLGADTNIPEYLGKTPLHYAAFCYTSWRGLRQYENDLLIVKSLLQHGAQVNSLTLNHETPLMSAVKGLHLGIIKELLERGADVCARNNQLETCLHIVAGTPDRDIFLELLKHGACAECFDEDGRTALDIILQSRRPQKLEYAKEFIKVAVLVNKGHWTEFSLKDKKFSLRKFVQKCFVEVVQMRSIQLSQNFSLLDFTLRSDCNANHNCAIEKSIFDTVLEKLKNFPIYIDIIEAHFQRLYLREKCLGMNIYAMYETAEVFLNSYVIDLIFSFLPNEDLLNFLKAFTNSSPRNGKQRNLQARTVFLFAFKILHTFRLLVSQHLYA